MPEIVFDNCVLSNFALSDSLHIIKSLYENKAYITDFVSSENLKGIFSGYQGLVKIREAARDGWLKETALKNMKEKTLFESLAVSIGFGEASGIAVAKTRGFVFACDDKAARREAGLLGVKLTGTIGILIKGVKKNVINSRQADKILHRMTAYGFYCPVSSIKEIL
ncbi:MAG: DUF3368 domain-containing protein [Nitrospirae bacterium]|nr:DUF3368 domain-containing protein [Nitrospirota bacterium]